MSCTITVQLAAAAAAATQLIVRNGGAIVASVKGARIPNFVWDGASSLLALVRNDDDTTIEHELPDITSELAAIQHKLSKVGKVRITIDVEPSTEVVGS